MHPAPTFLETDKARLLQRIETRPFALIISVKDGRPYAAHAPVIVTGPDRLGFHVSRANRAAEALEASGRALIIFTGPHDYISPDWYGLDDQVPTWNYLSVEAEGPVTPLGPDQTARQIDALSARFESALAPKPEWTRHKMTPGLFDKMLTGIVAFEMTLKRLEGITKLSQNKPAPARQRAGAALKQAGGNLTLSEMMEREE